MSRCLPRSVLSSAVIIAAALTGCSSAPAGPLPSATAPEPETTPKNAWRIAHDAVRQAPGSAIVTQGLTVHYRCDEGSGAVLHDAIGHNDGTIHGATFVKLPHGGALKFNGTSDYVDCGNPAALKPAYDCTFEVWVFVDEKPHGNMPGIVGKMPWEYGMNCSGWKGGHCFWGIDAGENQTAAPLTFGEWHHMAGTFDTVMLKLYVDGKLANERKSPYDVITEGGEHFYIGRSSDPSEGYGGWLKGMVTQIRIYERALTADEIKRNYDATRMQVVGPEAKSDK